MNGERTDGGERVEQVSETSAEEVERRDCDVTHEAQQQVNRRSNRLSPSHLRKVISIPLNFLATALGHYSNYSS